MVVFWMDVSLAKENLHEIFGYPVENVEKRRRL